MENIKLLTYSINNPERLLDENYMFINKHTELQKYLDNTKKIKHLLIAIQELKRKKSSDKIIDDFFYDLKNELNEYSNSSEFVCFVNACDTILKDVISDLDILKKITWLYLDNRDLTEIVPSEWIQAIIDKGSSRKKGKAGEQKLIKILNMSGYKYSTTLKDFFNSRKSVAQWSKGDFTTKNINRGFGTNFGKKTQGKSLDLIIKNNLSMYFLEAKHINTCGGAQNKQILELINIIKIKPSKENHHYVSFLDGVYFNIIFQEAKITNSVSKKEKESKNKLKKQKEDIYQALIKNKDNYFINTEGFKKLFQH